MVNRIVEENARTDGVTDRSYWDVPHSSAIEGFTTDISVNAGGTVDFKINVNGGAGSDYKIEIFRLGYYGGAGGREVAEILNEGAAVAQAAPLFDESRGLVDAGNWTVTDSWAVPADAVSGVYLARIQRLDASGDPIAGAANQIPFIVRNDGVPADIVLQTSDTTWQAYNSWAGSLGNAAQQGPNFYGDAAGIVDHDPLPNSGGYAQDRAYAVSYNRPFITRDGGPASGAQDYLFGADYAAIHWLEQNGYDVTYVSGVDTDRLGTSWFENAQGENIRKAFISVGHDEYWSGDQRINVESARDEGVNLLFWSGNEVYWKTRWDVSIAADGTEYRTLVCYKETWANGDPNAGPEDYNNIDPSNVWTGTWRDTRFWESVDDEGNLIAGGKYYVEGGGASAVDTISGLRSTCNCAENSLTGTLFGPDGNGQRASIDIPSDYGTLRVWRNTSIDEVGADLDDLNIADGILGYEWNTIPEDDSRPGGLIKLSETTRAWNNIVVDQGNSAPPGVATHSLSLYRAESGALVFGAGTVFWSWGLSDEHDSSPYGGNIETTAFKQFTVNMFADMGIQPGVADDILALQDLQRAFASTDATAAEAVIADLPDEIAALSLVQITGTASDVGGQVALVEVSLDGGDIWRVAQTTDGWETWSYDWRPTAAGVYTVQARAIDDSLNVLDATPDTETLEVTAPIPPDTFSLFEGLAPVSPTVLNDGGQPIEVGMRFTVDRAGVITELKYYRAAGDADDTDARDGHLWGPDGALLGTATFTSAPNATGWQVAALTAPVAILPGLDYRVSFLSSDGNYIATNFFFQPANEVTFDGVDDDAFSDYFGVISAPQNSVAGQSGTGGNGVYRYGSALTAPNDTFEGTNYWVDVTFDPAEGPNEPPAFTSPTEFTVDENQTGAAQLTGADPDGTALIFGIASGADAARFNIDPLSGALTFKTAPNFEAPADVGGNNVYDVTVSITDGIAAPVTQAVTVTVADVAEAPSTGSSLFDPNSTPGAAGPDATDYELGTKFTSNQSGFITTLQYFRIDSDLGDTDTRTLNLWNATTQANLGSVEVTATGSNGGWRVGVLAAPVAIVAGETYVVSYGYDYDGVNDNYAFDANYFATDRISVDGVLTAPSSAASGGNGVFAGGSPGSFPTGTFNATNYWVDVVFTTDIGGANAAPVFTPPATVGVTEGATAVATLTATDADDDALTFAIAGGADAGRFQVDATTGALTFTAAPDFEAATDANLDNVYQISVSVDDGEAPPVVRTIEVAVTDAFDTPTTGSNLFGAGDLPVRTETGDTTDYELGMRFTATADGQITELRYYRGAADAGDTDTRTLNFWTAGGANLGSVTITSDPGEAGWQVGALATPITIAANTTYFVSYGTTQNYAFSGGYFAPAQIGPDGVLSAPLSAGAFFQGGTGSFPDTSVTSNYWADVTFVAGAAPPNTPPAFTSPATFLALENQSAVGILAASDANSDPLSFAIVDGGDGALFRLNDTTGRLEFRTPQDFEGAAAQFNLTVSVTDGKDTAEQALTVTLADVDETVAGPAALTGATLTAEYVFGATLTDLYPGPGASQSAVAGAGVEYQNLPDAGDAVGNGPFGLASVDVGAQTIRVEFPLNAAFGDFLAFATVADKPFNGVRIADATNGLATIRGAAIIGQQGFTDQTGTPWR